MPKKSEKEKEKDLRTFVDLVHRNAKWAKLTGLPRPIYSNMEFTAEFKEYANKFGITLHQWNMEHTA